MNSTPTFSETISYSYQNIIVKLVQFIPLLVSAILIILIGWLIASIVARVVNKMLRLMKVDKIFAEARLDDFLKNAGSKKDAVSLLAFIVKWILLLVSFMAAVDTLQLPSVKLFFDRVISYTPNVIAAVLILFIGAILGSAVDKLIEGAAKASKLIYGQIISKFAKYSIWVFTVIAALSQLGIASDLLRIFFIGLMAMLALAGGLAFGLGGQNAARDLIDKLKKEANNN